MVDHGSTGYAHFLPVDPGEIDTQEGLSNGWTSGGLYEAILFLESSSILWKTGRSALVRLQQLVDQCRPFPHWSCVKAVSTCIQEFCPPAH